MRLNLLSYASGMGLIAGALLWPTTSPAQGFCYMVDADGAVTNLDSLCQSNDTPSPRQPQADPAGAAQSSMVPSGRGLEITGPASAPDPSQAPYAVDSTMPQPNGVDAGVTPTTPQGAPSPGVTPTTPQRVPASEVTPTTPQRVPSLGVTPTTPQRVPSSEVAPTTPQPSGADAGVAPAGAAARIDGAESDSGVATPATEIRVPVIVVPGIPVPRIVTP